MFVHGGDEVEMVVERRILAVGLVKLLESDGEVASFGE